MGMDGSRDSGGCVESFIEVESAHSFAKSANEWGTRLSGVPGGDERTNPSVSAARRPTSRRARSGALTLVVCQRRNKHAIYLRVGEVGHSPQSPKATISPQDVLVERRFSQILAPRLVTQLSQSLPGSQISL